MSFWTCSLDCSLTDVKRDAILVSTLKRKDEKEREKKRKEKIRQTDNFSLQCPGAKKNPSIVTSKISLFS